MGAVGRREAWSRTLADRPAGDHLGGEIMIRIRRAGGGETDHGQTPRLPRDEDAAH